jgi:hypothetical protein
MGIQESRQKRNEKDNHYGRSVTGHALEFREPMLRKKP